MSKKVKLSLSEDEAISLERVLQYLWEDEQENYNSMVEEGVMSVPIDDDSINGEPTDEEHIFYHVYKLNKKLQAYVNAKIDNIIKPE